MPAVDGVNGKVNFFAGTIANMDLYGAKGSVGLPLAGPYRLQIDGNLGNLGGSAYGASAAHLFWRNPGQGLLGVYGSLTGWNKDSGVWVSQIAGEGALYWGRWTVEGIAGVEFGNTVNSPRLFRRAALHGFCRAQRPRAYSPRVSTSERASSTT